MNRFRIASAIAIASLGISACGTSASKKTGQENPTLSSIVAGSDQVCGKALEDKLFSTFEANGNREEKDVAQLHFFTMSEAAAWDVYNNKRTIASVANQSAGLNVFEIVEIKAGGSGKKIGSFETFDAAFKLAKSDFQKFVDTSKFKNAADIYFSLVSDPTSVSAWSDCISAKSAETTLRMVLKRQARSEVIAQIIYNSNRSATAVPVLDVKFDKGTAVNTDDLIVRSGTKLLTIGVPDSAEAITINGQGGGLKFSFAALLPPTKQELTNLRCRVQNTLALSAGLISEALFQALEKSAFVAYPDRANPGAHQSTSCANWFIDLL